MPAETNHVVGQEGVRLVKRYLESTTHLALPHTIYDNEGLCSLEKLDGKVKRYDLVGHFITGTHRPVAVESKKVTGVAGQPAEFAEFLANAYSVTARQSQVSADDLREFMWVTWHPFAQKKWMSLRDEEELKEALAAHPEVLAGEDVDDKIVRKVSERLWLVPLHARVEELLLEPRELWSVLGVLDRRR